MYEDPHCQLSFKTKGEKKEEKKTMLRGGAKGVNLASKHLTIVLNQQRHLALQCMNVLWKNMKS